MPLPRLRRRRTILFTLAGVVLATALSSCSSPIPRRDPTGAMFPSVEGESLEGERVRIPEDFAGAPVLLLVGYEQDTQFDLDRWLLGLFEAEVAVEVREVPTIGGLVPRIIGDWIDSGMRRGIPSEDWGSVVTVYRDADAICELTGTEDPLPGRILLLDASGRVIFFHDRGYSVGTLAKLREVLARSAD